MKPASARRPLCLTAFCVLAWISALVGCFKGLTMKDQLIAQCPRLEPPVFWIYFAIVPLIAVGAIGLWRMARWGFWLTLALALATIGFDLWVGMEAAHLAGVGTLLALLLASVLPRWKRLA